MASRSRRSRTEDEWWQAQDSCECPCHKEDDHCAVCTHEYRDLCAGRLAVDN